MDLLGADPKELVEKLRQYLASDRRYQVVYAYTKERFENAADLTAHNWAHAYKDTLTAIVIGEAEGADMYIVLPAITMHDIGFLYGATGKTHGAVGAERVAEFLHQAGAHYSDEQIEAISSCIRTHKGSMHDEKPESLEAKVVADADLLDKFGPFGVYQGIRTYTEFNFQIDEILKKEEEIFSLTLETETGKRLAEPGRQFVADFYKSLREAYYPYSIEP